MMTRRDYEAIAKVIKAEVEQQEYAFHSTYALERIAQGLADYFRHTNGRFNRKRFLAACGFVMPPVNEDAVRSLVEDPYNAADRLIFTPPPGAPTDVAP